MCLLITYFYLQILNRGQPSIWHKALKWFRLHDFLSFPASILESVMTKRCLFKQLSMFHKVKMFHNNCILHLAVFLWGLLLGLLRTSVLYKSRWMTKSGATTAIQLSVTCLQTHLFHLFDQEDEIVWCILLNISTLQLLHTFLDKVQFLSITVHFYHNFQLRLSLFTLIQCHFVLAQNKQQEQICVVVSGSLFGINTCKELSVCQLKLETSLPSSQRSWGTALRQAGQDVLSQLHFWSPHISPVEISSIDHSIVVQTRK